MVRAVLEFGRKMIIFETERVKDGFLVLVLASGSMQSGPRRGHLYTDLKL